MTDDEKRIERDIEEMELDDSKVESGDEMVQVEKDKGEIQVKESFGSKFPKTDGVVNTEVIGEMKQAYLDYAMSVIVSRAIPAIEDGMKPVQRRILYAMQQLGLKPSGQTKKSARVVGDVIGKYHPHGDSAVYEAMVRMAQDFSLRYPLVYGQGNFGSIDGDSAAAMRYTEAKMEKLSAELLEDLDKETVEFVDNYDGSLKEPILLPGKLPALVLNGATGIAVGMATNIPPHNLREIADAISMYIDNPEITIEELVNKAVQGPDFPTGGMVQGNMVELYKTGKGRLIMRGKTVVEKKNKKEIIVITEIPYMINKATLITQIASLVRDKKIKNISDLRDESSKGKIRIVIELKKGVNPDFVINALYKYTRLQDSFNVNFLALVEGKPRILGLKDVLENYVRYRKKIIINRTRYDLNKAKLRQEIVEGLLKALDNIDEIIKIIRFGKEPSHELKTKFEFTDNQIKAILETKLRQLTSLEYNKLKEEFKELEKKIVRFEKILGDIKEVLKIIKKEVNELKENYGDPRRTQIFKRSFSEISEKDLIQEKEVVVSITEKGYVKRMDVKTYKEQKRGGRGVIGSGLATGDFSKQILTCSTHDYLMFFTTRGRVLWLKAYDLPEAERYGKGKAIVNLLGLKEEKVTSIISVKNFDDFLMMATKKGIIKRIALSYFSKPRSSGVKAINLPLNNSDNLIGVEIVKENQEVILATKNGKAIRFDSKDVRSMGRSSYGVTGIKLSEGDEVVSLEVLDTDAIFTITKKGYGKRTSVEDYRKTSRAGKGVINIKISDKTGEVVNTVSVNNDDSIIITTAKGMVIRTSLQNIRVMGRAAQGVRVVRLQDGDYVTDVIRVIDAE
jgi:DNA gyrase subunit A